jgi:hypothetical protein
VTVLAKLVMDFAMGIQAVDSMAPVASNARTGAAYQPGIGPHTEAQTIRLASHASGRRSGDQFCVYVFDRLVLPMLSRQQIQEAARGQLSLDDLTRQLIRQSFSYRFTLLGDAAMARTVERDIQRDGLFDHPPLLNPLPRIHT